MANNLINKMVWLNSSKYVVNGQSSQCSVVAIFVILNGSCLIFVVAGNVLGECRDANHYDLSVMITIFCSR